MRALAYRDRKEAIISSQHTIPGVIEFKPGNGGLTKAMITTPLASAEIYLHGAHVTDYMPKGQAPVLFMSGKSRFENGKAIRGGVPVCFPWFGNLANQPQAPAHGFARTSEWSIEDTRQNSDSSTAITLAFEFDQSRSPWWPHAARAEYTVTVGKTLKLELQITNQGSEPFTFEEALHSYFHVGDVRQVSVTGLEKTHFLDKMQANRELTEGSDPIRIIHETDRIYLDTTSACEITDPKLKRKITNSKQGSSSTVLWNPWIAKARTMPDFGDDEWPDMLCIETCNVGPSAVSLQPGESHTMKAEIQSTID